jgi:Dyp-type peroxidase family
MVDQKDIQGFILRGYGKLKHSAFVLLRIEDKDLAKKWMQSISGRITNGTHYPETTCLNLGVTHAGLAALGMKAENLRNFAREFREGFGDEHRQRMLGDEGASHPDKWRWGGNAAGGRDERNIHLLLLVFARSKDMLDTFYTELEGEFTAHKISVISRLDGNLRDDNKERFGFRDGISQPTIKGIGDDESNEHNVVATGEFLLGHKNEYGVYPDSPFITSAQGDMNLLPLDEGGTGNKDIGKNGSYLVFRQMEEDIEQFWTFMNENSRSADGAFNKDESIKLASKMMGRWPSGAPLVKYPDRDPGGESDDDDFGFADDKLGLKCPFGSHIRRNNPRDAFEDNNPKKSLSLTKKHRILRRGRPYGEAIAATPSDYKTNEEVGLHFMCFNADISKQFEFLQHTWSNFPRFQNLYNDPDPFIGIAEDPHNKLVQNFTVQAEPVNKCIANMQRFVTIRGGAYFFFPSITSVEYLAGI